MEKIVKSGWKGKLLPSRLFKYRMRNNNNSFIGKKVLDKEHSSQKKYYVFLNYGLLVIKKDN
jgi:hypothetical protein